MEIQAVCLEAEAVSFIITECVFPSKVLYPVGKRLPVTVCSYTSGSLVTLMSGFRFGNALC